MSAALQSYVRPWADARRRSATEMCVVYFHPPVTYNPWHDRTWCLCGVKTYPGDVATHAACCDGPLIESDDSELSA